jgi:hypothetical protein
MTRTCSPIVVAVFAALVPVSFAGGQPADDEKIQQRLGRFNLPTVAGRHVR